MRFEKKTNRIDEFWAWFQSASLVLAGGVENPTLTRQMDEWVRELEPKLSWEIGPGSVQPWQLVISPNLDQTLREAAKSIVARAPEIAGWEFHSARQPKDWNYQVELETGEGIDLIRLDASKWTFVLLRYPDGAHEVLLKGDDAQLMTGEERWQAAAIVLESVLGEEVLMDRINAFDLVTKLEPRFDGNQRPIQALRDAVITAPPPDAAL